jgi:hypothetical protein
MASIQMCERVQRSLMLTRVSRLLVLHRVVKVLCISRTMRRRYNTLCLVRVTAAAVDILMLSVIRIALIVDNS